MAIVAIEAPPLGVAANFRPTVAMYPEMAYGSAGGALLFGVLIASEAPEAAKSAGAASKSIEELLSETDAWLPTKVLAEEVGVQLTNKLYGYVVVDPAVRAIPGVKDRTYTLFMENWMAPIRSWYGSNPSEVDYAGVPQDVDAVVEVGISNYEFHGKSMLLQVHLRLVNSTTRKVLGRSRKWKDFKIGVSEEAFANEGEVFKERFSYWGSQLISDALLDMNMVQM
jgi:hypothetical protein